MHSTAGAEERGKVIYIKQVTSIIGNGAFMPEQRRQSHPIPNISSFNSLNLTPLYLTLKFL